VTWLPQLLLRRLLVLVPLLLLISLGVFALLELAPGDPARSLLGTKQATAATLAAIRAKYHLDEPFLMQYVRWLGGIVSLDFGRSITTNQPVLDAIGAKIPSSLFLGLYGFIITVTVGLPLGILAALRRASALDRSIVGFSVVGVSAPAFASGILLLYVFGVLLGWLPVFGPGKDFGDELYHLTLPAIALALSAMALVVKVTRASMVEELDKDYIAFARARGLSKRRVIFGYALRNALVSITTAVGLVFIYMITGAVLVEVTFALPGLGSLLVASVRSLDIPMVQALAMLIAVFVVVVHLAIDVVYALLDPRVRFGRVAE
jgi:peptide/nickel transport system permease protein